MAKDKADGRGKSDGKPSMKIPKEFGGVKVPKTLRKSGKVALKLAQNPVAREMLAAGLMAAATAVAANRNARRTGQQGARNMADTLNEAADSMATGANKVGAALLAAAAEAAQRFLDGRACAPTTKTADPFTGDGPFADAGASAEPGNARPDEPQPPTPAPAAPVASTAGDDDQVDKGVAGAVPVASPARRRRTPRARKDVPGN